MYNAICLTLLVVAAYTNLLLTIKKTGRGDPFNSNTSIPSKTKRSNLL